MKIFMDALSQFKDIYSFKSLIESRTTINLLLMFVTDPKQF